MELIEFGGRRELELELECEERLVWNLKLGYLVFIGIWLPG